MSLNSGAKTSPRRGDLPSDIDATMPMRRIFGSALEGGAATESDIVAVNIRLENIFLLPMHITVDAGKYAN
jgi:hypothetical protein